MPPPQRLLSTRLRGFVCKSCLSKLQPPQRQYLPLLARTFASDNKLKKRKQALDIPVTVRYFEQTEDGVRTELKDEDDDDEVYTETVMQQLKEIEEETGRTMYELNDEDLQRILQATMPKLEPENTEGLLLNPFMGPGDPAEIEKKALASAAAHAEIQAKINFINSFDLENLSQEDRIRLRERLLKSQNKDKPPDPQVPDQPESRVSEGRVPDGDNTYTPLALPVSSFPEKSRGYIYALEQCVNPPPKEKVQLKQPVRKRSRPNKSLSDTVIRIRETWRAYAMCRNALVTAPQLVSPRFWTALWNILEKEDINNLDRMPHLKIVGDDMQRSGVNMTSEQLLVYIEATFIEADQATAIQMWESQGSNSSAIAARKEYWDLGARMFSRHRLIDRALDCAGHVLLETKSPNDFRLLLPIIGAVLKSDDKSSIQLAWALYIRLRANLGRNITMEDYDSLISMFMESNRQEQALGIFKDMMLRGGTGRSDRDSISRYKSSVGISADLSSIEIPSTELDWQDFNIVDKLPSHFNNHIFFASWMKKLIGDEELASAEKVYYIMQERGIRPSSISTNGLIGAWYRKGTEKYRQKADDLAWKMIEERKKLVTIRSQKYNMRVLEGPIRPVMVESRLDFKPANVVPYATIETFAILLQQYRRRQKLELIPGLFEALEDARIRPNTDFMNEMLLTDMKARSAQWALKTYRSLTGPEIPAGRTVQPNFKTYEILWEILARAYDPVLPKEVGLEPPRTVFGDMMRHLRSVKGPLPNDLYQIIILCFCLQKDQVGTVVALEALQAYFGNFPTGITARTIVLSIARTGHMNDSGYYAPRRLAPTSKNSKRRIEGVTQALAFLRERRIEHLRLQGIEFERLDAKRKLEESSLLLSELLRYGYENKPVNSGARKEETVVARRTAAEMMAVPELAPWGVEVS